MTIYKCDICGKILEDKDTRLRVELHLGDPIIIIKDYCDECYKKIFKQKEE